MSPNVAAFLTMLAKAEGTERIGSDAYRVCYGYRHIIVSLTTHPADSGEWMGERITVGKYAGQMSTAAGRYQINLPTFRRLALRLGTRSFMPWAQDDFAVELLKQAGAFAAINAGDIHSAIHLCSSTWASLPYSDAGQPTHSIDTLLANYQGAGGALV